MVSKPPFRVEISKGGDSTLNFQCNFPPAGEEVQQNPESGEQYGACVCVCVLVQGNRVTFQFPSLILQISQSHRSTAR